MKEKLTNNLGLKFLSITLAIFAWFMVVNVVNPLVVDSEEVPVEMINEDILSKANLTYDMVGKKTVTVTYEVRTRDRYKVSASDFYAYADLANLYDVTGSIPVTVEVIDRDARSLIEGGVTVKPGVVRIQTEELQRKKFEVVPHVNGKPEDGYAVGNVFVRPEYVYVTGAVSVVGQISSVGVEIDTSGADSDTSGSSRVILYDANGNELDDLGNDITLNRSEVEYQVSILKVKELSLDFQVSGEVAEGYRFTGVESDVRTVSVEGMRSVLASLGTIVVPGELLNIEGATSDVTVEVDLNELLPDNISMAAFSAQTAMIVLKVEPLAEQMVTLKVQKLELVGASQDYEYNFEEDEIAVWIRGLPEDLERLDVGALTGRADVTGMGPGYYSVEVVIDLADGFEILESDLLSVHIEDPNAGPGESEEGETEAETETEETSAQG